jgi:uncharacterized protein YcbX
MSSIVLTQLTIYPIKSCKGIALQSAQLEERGLRYDRRWMVVDGQYRFVSQREMPRLALVSVALHPGHLRVTAPGMHDLHVPLAMTDEDSIRVSVWDDDVAARDVGEEAGEWFTSYLGIPARLVHMPDSADRAVSARGHRSRVSFADATPLLLISEASLDDLNTRLAEPLPMNRFRPNLVVKGCEPYAEDTWNEMVVGSTTLHVAQACSRCMTTTVDQLTGEKGKEPLRALASYRQRDGEVYFGQRLIHRGFGTIHLGDEVKIIG